MPPNSGRDRFPAYMTHKLAQCLIHGYLQRIAAVCCCLYYCTCTLTNLQFRGRTGIMGPRKVPWLRHHAIRRLKHHHRAEVPLPVTVIRRGEQRAALVVVTPPEAEHTPLMRPNHQGEAVARQEGLGDVLSKLECAHTARFHARRFRGV